jgi:hypothetical protein
VIDDAEWEDIARDAFSARVADVVMAAGKRFGFGALMQAAQIAWTKWAAENGVPDSEFVIGPCAAFSVACACTVRNVHRRKLLDENGHCEWCCGCGWVTPKVRKIQKEHMK